MYIYNICIYIFLLEYIYIYSSKKNVINTNSLGSFDDSYVASKTDSHGVTSRI